MRPRMFTTVWKRLAAASGASKVDSPISVGLGGAITHVAAAFQALSDDRPAFDEAAVLAAIQPHLAAARMLFLGSFEARHAGFLHRVLDQFRGCSYLMITRSQLGDFPRTLELMRRVTISQLNAQELRNVAAQAEVVDGINALRQAGIGSIIVTAGPGGIFAYTQGQPWWAASLDVSVTCDIGAGDTVGGVACAGVASGLDFSDTLRCASAAAARKISGLAPSGSWDELRTLYSQTRHLPPRRAHGPSLVSTQHAARHSGRAMNGAAATLVAGLFVASLAIPFAY